MRRFSFLIPGLAALAAGCSEPAAAPATDAAATAAVPAPAFSQDGLAALDAAMKAQVDQGVVPGLAYALVQDGETIAEAFHGVRTLGGEEPIAADTIYRIYSMTKPVTGVAMMTLYEEGAWALDDPVTKFVPELKGLQVLAGVDENGGPILEDAARAPTMRELMSHTAGFGYGLAQGNPVDDRFRAEGVLASPGLDAMIEKVADIPLLFQPGERWSYSIAVDIQGLIVERLSGQSFGKYLDEKIFTPLGMDDTGFYVPDADRGRLADVVVAHPETGQIVSVERTETLDARFKEGEIPMESGGGGLVSTLPDYARFAGMLANGGELDGVRVLKPETVQLMRTNLLDPDMRLFSDGGSPGLNTEGLGFGLDFGVVADAEAVGWGAPEGTYFWGGAAGTWFWIDPANDLFFIGMIQRYDASGEEFRVASSRLVYEALAE